MFEYLKILLLLYADDTIILAKTAGDFQNVSMTLGNIVKYGN